MSGKLIGQVYEREVGHAEQAVLVAMAYHADDFGNNCFPSVPCIAWKTGYKERQVQRIIARLRDMGVLVLVCEATRYRPTEYHVNLDALPAKPAFARGDIYDARGDIPPASGVTFTEPGVSFSTPGVSFETPRGVIAMTPEPEEEPEEEEEAIDASVVANPPPLPKPRIVRNPSAHQLMVGAIFEVRGLDTRLASVKERANVGTAATAFLAIGATPDDVRDAWRIRRAEIVKFKPGERVTSPSVGQLTDLVSAHVKAKADGPVVDLPPGHSIDPVTGRRSVNWRLAR